MKGRSILKLITLLLLVAVAAVYSPGPIKQSMKLGLDLRGGISVTLQADEKSLGRPLTDQDMEQVKAVMRNRVDQLGVSEPYIQREGKNRIVIQLAGIDDPEQAVELIGKTAKLEFRDQTGKVIVDGSQLKEVQAGKNPTSGEALVSLTFDSEGSKKFAQTTSELVQKYPDPNDPRRAIGIYLDNDQLQNPIVKEAITNGQAQITGYADLKEAHDIALLLRSGALPVSMEIIEKRAIGPFLGKESLDKSSQAGLYGILAILIFMIGYYRLPGLLANVALVAYGLLVLWILISLNAVLTLPGIAGFLLSIGMAVDANVIIYERLKEELRNGKSIRAAIDAGFSRAFWTIFDANVTTLIATAVLFYLGSGPIKGFAVTLSIGILVSMFSAITFTRWLLRFTAQSDLVKSRKLYGE